MQLVREFGAHPLRGELRIRVGRGHVCLVGTLLALEVDPGIAASCRRRRRLPVVVEIFLGNKALMRCPRVEERPVDGEMIAADEAFAAKHLDVTLKEDHREFSEEKVVTSPRKA